MVKSVSALPAGCAKIPPGARTAEFAKWQAEVINYAVTGAKESLPGLVSKQTLALPLRPDISNLHFSPDGKYLLAQDEGGIHVLTREPLQVLFYIPAVDARDAKFSPDSRAVVFHYSSLRVETWSITDEKRSSAHELTLLHPCLQTELSPDGSTLGCLDEELQLVLVDVASGKTLVIKKSFVELSFVGKMLMFLALASGNVHFIDMHFSPDGRYFVAGAWSAHFAWDVSDRRELSLPGSIRDVLKESFTFLDPGRIIGIETSSPAKSPILRFPTGERIGQIRLGNGIHLRAVTRGDYVFVGPLKKQPLGLLDLRTAAVPIEFKRDAADVFDGILVTERVTGELGLYSVGNIDPLATVKLAQARLGALQAAAVSRDFNWMAVSNRTRGAVWDITHNIRTMEVTSFHGVWAADDQTFYVDLAKFGDMERQIVRIDPRAGTVLAGYKTGEVIATQYGPYFVVTVPKEKRASRKFIDADVEVHDTHDGHIIWKHHFDHDLPELAFGAGAVLLSWPVATDGGRSELQQLPELRHGDDTDYLSELRDLKTDSIVNRIRINTNKGSFGLQHAFIAGDWLITSATNNQVLTYLFATGEQKGHFFGTHPNASAAGGLLAVNSDSDHLKLYELANSQLRQEYAFPDTISFKSFSPDGKRLLVLTANQIVYILDVAAR
jgi:WD40 repeat protein